MELIVVGVSFKTAPIDVLEKATMEADEQARVRRKLLEQPHIAEAMIISTCNRMECYCAVEATAPGANEVVKVLAEHAGVPAEELRAHTFIHGEGEAARHLMSVTAGMDSLVVGEQQIIGQVRQAFAGASEAGDLGPMLNDLVPAALHAGKRVHTETQIDKFGPSLVTHSIGVLRRELGWQDFTGKTALIIGAGAMASLAASYLGTLGVGQLIISNRTRDRAENLAAHAREAGVWAEVLDWPKRATALERADIVISATGFAHYTITAADVAAAGRNPDDLAFVDLSLPRDIDPKVPAYLISIETLMSESNSMLDDAPLAHVPGSNTGPGSQGAESGAADQRNQIFDDRVAAEAILEEELAHYVVAARQREVAPALAALRARASDIVESEVERFRNKHEDLDPQVIEHVAQTVRRAMDKILHAPTVRTKRLASDGADAEQVLNLLFALEDTK